MPNLITPISGAKLSRAGARGPDAPAAIASSSVVGEPQESLFMEYMKLAQRHRWAILATAVTGCLLALFLTMLMRPIYHTRASVDIEGLNGDFMNIREVARTNAAGPDSNEVNQQTQIKPQAK